MGLERLFDQPLQVINVGLTSFAEDLRNIGVDFEQVSLEGSIQPGDANLESPLGEGEGSTQ